MNYDVIVIGAGASGLVAAIAAARQKSKVLVIEQKEKAGKKILATGNGKCNYTNLFQSPECYRSDDSAFPMKVLSCFDVQNTIQFFEELGIYPKERNGYLYPNSEQAASLVQVLIMECERLGVTILYNEKVIKINEPNFTINTESHQRYFAHKLILATGGCASPKLGSDGSGYQFAINFGHTLIKPLPALVQLKSSDKFCKTLSGVRAAAKVIALISNTVLSQEEGEILFTDYGISGIPILQVSRFVAKALNQGKRVHMMIDFLPQMSEIEVESMMKKRIELQPNKNLEEIMVGLFNHKLSYIMIKEANLDLNKTANKLTDREIESLINQIKAFQLTITDTNSFENAQVSAGGIPTKEVNEKTLESKCKKGLYLVGEIIDVDGTCGGYNLQWAWSTGYLAGTNAGLK